MTPMRYNMHLLALELGMTVTQLINAMPWAEYRDWATFYNMRNKGETPVDWEKMTPQQIKAKLGL